MKLRDESYGAMELELLGYGTMEESGRDTSYGGDERELWRRSLDEIRMTEIEVTFSNSKPKDAFCITGEEKKKATCHEMWHLATWLTSEAQVGPTSYKCVLPPGHLITYQPKKK